MRLDGACLLLSALAALPAQSPPIQIQVQPNRVIRTFDATEAFGTSVDGQEHGNNSRMLSPASVALMKTAGLKALTYRLRTELGGEVWHWNPEGTWSDPKRKEGYWTSSAAPGKPILESYGYRLTRRGNTIDQALNNGYSRLDDGDLGTFWKSNPYLDPHYTHEPYSAHPEWIVIGFGNVLPINHLRIHWAAPYAARFEVDTWSSDTDEWTGTWHTVAANQKGNPGVQEVDFPQVQAEFLKIQLLESSETALPHCTDPRDAMGFAVRELEAGLKQADGSFHDAIRHGKTQNAQTWMCVSSTDPWHREEDKDANTEQPGFDLIARTHLSNGRPMLMPTGALYDTPENVAAEVKWLKAKHFSLRGLEIGEEPDGQSADAVHFGLLYAQMAATIRRIDPKVRLGGPSFQTAHVDYCDFPRGGPPWLTQFKDTLRREGHLQDFQFVSFEWYPFDDVLGNPSRQLQLAVPLLRESVKRLQGAGMAGMPWLITEYGWSAYAAQPEVEIPGAIFDLDLALNALALGARTTYAYGYEPDSVIQEKPGAWGNNMLFLDDGETMQPMPTCYAARLLTKAACMPRGVHRLLEVSGAPSAVGAYAIRRPDGRIALVLTNRADGPLAVALQGLGPGVLKGFRYDARCYRWLADGEHGHPLVNQPPYPIAAREGRTRLPAMSITVLLNRTPLHGDVYGERKVAGVGAPDANR